MKPNASNPHGRLTEAAFQKPKSLLLDHFTPAMDQQSSKPISLNWVMPPKESGTMFFDFFYIASLSNDQMKHKEPEMEVETNSCFKPVPQVSQIPTVTELSLPTTSTAIASAPPPLSTAQPSAPSRLREISSSLFPKIISSKPLPHKGHSLGSVEQSKQENETQSKAMNPNPNPNPNPSMRNPFINNHSSNSNKSNNNNKFNSKNKNKAENKIDWSLLNKAKISLYHAETTRPRPTATPMPLSQCMEIGLGASSQTTSFRSNKRNISNDHSSSGKEWRETLNEESEHLPSESSSASAVKGNVTAQLMSCILDREKINASSSTADHGVVVVCEEESSVLKLVIQMVDGEFKDKLMMMVLSTFMNRSIGIHEGVTVGFENDWLSRLLLEVDTKSFHLQT